MAHEALIKQWPRLRNWIDQERETLLFHRSLSQRVKEWHHNDRDDSYLLRGIQLERLKEWPENKLSTLEREFLNASVRVEQAILQERERNKVWPMALAGLGGGMVGGIVGVILTSYGRIEMDVLIGQALYGAFVGVILALTIGLSILLSSGKRIQPLLSCTLASAALSAIINWLFTGELYIWLAFLAGGVYGFFISVSVTATSKWRVLALISATVGILITLIQLTEFISNAFVEPLVINIVTAIGIAAGIIVVNYRS